MIIREYSLPAGWYPRDSRGVSDFLSNFSRKTPYSNAAIAPHAGWYYSGRLAARSVCSLDPQAQTIAVLGGHLPSGAPALFAMEDAVKTPFGFISIDLELRSSLIKELDGAKDNFRDNTIEVLLPMVHFFFPDASLLWMRLPAEISSFETGKIIFQTAEKLNRKINVLGSTDLTHYGKNYGFSPKGNGKEALRWMREVNDANFIRAVESGSGDEVLRCAHQDNSACSPGSVLGVMGFANAANSGTAHLLEYSTSADVNGDEIPDSFVGYAAFAFN